MLVPLPPCLSNQNMFLTSRAWTERLLYRRDQNERRDVYQGRDVCRTGEWRVGLDLLWVKPCGEIPGCLRGVLSSHRYHRPLYRKENGRSPDTSPEALRSKEGKNLHPDPARLPDKAHAPEAVRCCSVPTPSPHAPAHRGRLHRRVLSGPPLTPPLPLRRRKS